jgi:hypothetical protein
MRPSASQQMVIKVAIVVAVIFTAVAAMLTLMWA